MGRGAGRRADPRVVDRPPELPVDVQRGVPDGGDVGLVPPRDRPRPRAVPHRRGARALRRRLGNAVGAGDHVGRRALRHVRVPCRGSRRGVGTGRGALHLHRRARHRPQRRARHRPQPGGPHRRPHRHRVRRRVRAARPPRPTPAGRILGVRAWGTCAHLPGRDRDRGRDRRAGRRHRSTPAGCQCRALVPHAGPLRGRDRSSQPARHHPIPARQPHQHVAVPRVLPGRVVLALHLVAAVRR